VGAAHGDIIPKELGGTHVKGWLDYGFDPAPLDTIHNPTPVVDLRIDYTNLNYPGLNPFASSKHAIGFTRLFAKFPTTSILSPVIIDMVC